MIAALERRAIENHEDIKTLVGLSGAYIDRPQAALFGAWREFAARRGWVSGYLQLNALVDSANCVDPSELGISNAVEILNLRKFDEAALSARMKEKIAAPTIGGWHLTTDRARIAHVLPELYGATLSRVSAGRDYQFSQKTLLGLASMSSAFVVGAERDGRIEAAVLFLGGATQAEYAVHASTDAAIGCSAMLIASAIAHFKAAGKSVLNLGGGARPDDGLHNFKKRFGGKTYPVASARQIYDAGAYLRLAGSRTNAAWFPAYRAKLAFEPTAPISHDESVRLRAS
jgi:hypothetical protein